MDRFIELPTDIQRFIALKLDLRNIARLSITCKVIHDKLCNSEDFWKMFYRRDLSENIHVEKNASIRQMFAVHYRQIRSLNSYSQLVYLADNRLEMALVNIANCPRSQADRLLTNLIYYKENGMLERITILAVGFLANIWLIR